MKFTLDWLKTHIDTHAGLEEITECLTNLGLEVEEVINRGPDLAEIIVGYVVESRAHPDADKLSLCLVDTGTSTVQVVCGAPNVRTGIKGVFAGAGTVIPGTGVKLKETKIRGEMSAGMLCSEKELGLGEDHDGIIELPEDATPGSPIASVLGLDDPVIDIAVTPNRQDCLGVRGIARDLAASRIGMLRPLIPNQIDGHFPSPIDVHITSADQITDPCPLFVGRYVRGVRNGPSPRWLQNRLRAIGLRPISTLVDITNFVTIDLGRPLHVFDADKLVGSIAVRLSVPGEKFQALNGKNYTLSENVTVIADDDGVLSLAGIIGGERSRCTESTRNVFIESALFDPIRTAMAGRNLAIESDARYRFERGVDPASTYSGIELGTKLAIDMCGGEASELVEAGAEPIWSRDLELRPSRMLRLGGVDVPKDKIFCILKGLGFGVKEFGERFLVSVPSWRSDVTGEADLVEEVVRLYGYENIPEVPLDKTLVGAQPALSLAQRRRGLVRRVLASRGLDEVVSWSFLPSRQAELFGGGAAGLRLENPISSELDAMRPSLLANLITAAAKNNDRGLRNVAMFEVGPIYTDDTPEGQKINASAIRCHMAVPRHWAGGSRSVDAFDAKADALAVLSHCKISTDKVRSEATAPDWYHPGRSARLMLGPKVVLGSYGEIHPTVLERFDISGPIVGFEVFLDSVPVPKSRSGYTRSRLTYIDFPIVERDFSFVVDSDVPSADVVSAAAGADRQLIKDVKVFDVYMGEGINDGQKSIALTVRLEPLKRTLTEAEIDEVSNKIVTAVSMGIGGQLRT